MSPTAIPLSSKISQQPPNPNLPCCPHATSKMFTTRSNGLDSLLDRRYPSHFEQFLSAPTPFLARVLYNSLPAKRPLPEIKGDTLAVVCISDTLGAKPQLPPGDLLLHSGNLTVSGTPEELHDKLEWISSQPHRYKVVIAGNHETCLDPENSSDEKAYVDWETLSAAGLVYLNNSSIILHFPSPLDRSIKIYGSPSTPKCGAGAFQYMADQHPWTGVIPIDTDIVMTHGPPKYHLDFWKMLGCGYLLRELWQVRPLLHVFGHVRAGYGKEFIRWDEMQKLYEGACSGGKWALFRMVGLWAWCWVSHRLFGGEYDERAGGTVLVNASYCRSKGPSLKDDLKNEAIVVHL